MVIVSNVMRTGQDRESCYRKTNWKENDHADDDEVRKHCRVVGEGIVAAVAAGEDLGKRFEGVQSMIFWGQDPRKHQ